MNRKPTLCRPTQLSLFRPQPKIPNWRVLPVDTRREVKVLLALLLREHRAARLEIDRRQEASNE